MSKERYMEVVFRSGKPLAAYLYLPRKEGDQSVQVKKYEHGLIVDYANDGRPIGIEIPLSVTVETIKMINDILGSHGLSQIDESDLIPLQVK